MRRGDIRVGDWVRSTALPPGVGPGSHTVGSVGQVVESNGTYVHRDGTHVRVDFSLGTGGRSTSDTWWCSPDRLEPATDPHALTAKEAPVSTLNSVQNAVFDHLTSTGGDRGLRTRALKMLTEDGFFVDTAFAETSLADIERLLDEDRYQAPFCEAGRGRLLTVARAAHKPPTKTVRVILDIETPSNLDRLGADGWDDYSLGNGVARMIAKEGRVSHGLGNPFDVTSVTVHSRDVEGDDIVRRTGTPYTSRPDHF